MRNRFYRLPGDGQCRKCAVGLTKRFAPNQNNRGRPTPIRRKNFASQPVKRVLTEPELGQHLAVAAGPVRVAATAGGGAAAGAGDSTT